MSIENVKKLELGIRKAVFCDGIYDIFSRSERQMLIDEGMDLEEEALKSGDDDVLDRAFEYFLEESVDNGLGNGVCETMEGEIWQYFTPEQILRVFEVKIKDLIDKNMTRCEHFIGGLIAHGCFEEVRTVFHTLDVEYMNELLINLDDWIGDEFPNEIALLREDMKKW